MPFIMPVVLVALSLAQQGLYDIGAFRFLLLEVVLTALGS
jgi:hypothetical protein